MSNPTEEFFGSQVIRPDAPGKDLELVVDPIGATETGITIKGSGSNAGGVGINNPDPKERLDVKGNIKGDKLLGIGSCPTGMIAPFAGQIAPDGWLFCDGASYQITDYSELAHVVGTAFNNENDDPTKFRVPNLNGRFPLGRGEGSVSLASFGADPKVVGSTGGSDLTQLAIANMPAHSHTVGALAHKGSLKIDPVLAHVHRFHAPGFTAAAPRGAVIEMDLDAPLTTDEQADSPTFPQHYKLTTREAGDHTHTSTLAIDPHPAGATDSVGSGSKFSRIPPAIVLNYIIKG